MLASVHIADLGAGGTARAVLRKLRSEDDVPRSRAVPHEGPVIVFTLGWLRVSQLPRFLKTSNPAERSANASEGMLWGSAAVRPPFVATVSMWRDSQAAAGYAYGKQRPEHSDAIVEQRRKDFHKRSAFIRFAPTFVSGSLGGKNPLPSSAVDLVHS